MTENSVVVVLDLDDRKQGKPVMRYELSTNKPQSVSIVIREHGQLLVCGTVPITHVSREEQLFKRVTQPKGDP